MRNHTCWESVLKAVAVTPFPALHRPLTGAGVVIAPRCWSLPVRAFGSTPSDAAPSPKVERLAGRSTKLESRGDTRLLLLVDGHNLAYRCFLSRGSGPMRTSTGIPTKLSYRFLRSLLATMRDQQPSAVAVAFDSGPSFRHAKYPPYKATRKKNAEDMLTFDEDLANLCEVLAAMRVSVVKVPGYEADDVISTLARQASAQGSTVKILSRDTDLMQLVSDSARISILLPPPAGRRPSGAVTTRQHEELDEHSVFLHLKVKPKQVVDFKALIGEPSDNLPGIQGIGPTTASRLLAQYNSLEGVLAAHASGDLKLRSNVKLEEGKEEICRVTRSLAQLCSDVPELPPIDDLQLHPLNHQAVSPLLTKLEFESLLVRDLSPMRKAFLGAGSPYRRQP